MNSYQYVGNNSINYIDPYGLKKDDPFHGKSKDFWNWYHDPSNPLGKKRGDLDLTKEQADELEQEWERQGKPKPRKDKHKDKKNDNNTNQSRMPNIPMSSDSGGFWMRVAVEVCGVVTWYLVWVAPYTPIPDPY